MRAPNHLIASLSIAALCWAPLDCAPSQAPPLEFLVKTSYLFNFLQFVDWPEDAFENRDEFMLCVVTRDDYRSAVDALATERVNGRDISIRYFDAVAAVDPSVCHALFVTQGKSATGAPGMGTSHGLLTVGDVPGFLERGGIINLVETHGKIRFEINLSAAKQAGLVISSKLLGLSIRLL